MTIAGWIIIALATLTLGTIIGRRIYCLKKDWYYDSTLLYVILALILVAGGIGAVVWQTANEQANAVNTTYHTHYTASQMLLIGDTIVKIEAATHLGGTIKTK